IVVFHMPYFIRHMKYCIWHMSPPRTRHVVTNLFVTTWRVLIVSGRRSLRHERLLSYGGEAVALNYVGLYFKPIICSHGGRPLRNAGLNGLGVRALAVAWEKLFAGTFGSGVFVTDVEQ